MFNSVVGIRTPLLGRTILRNITKISKYNNNYNSSIRRFQSNIANSSSTSTSVKNISQNEIDIAKSLNWADFFVLRKKQRQVSLIGSVLSSFLFTGIAWSYLSTKELDLTETETIFGMDQFTMYIGGIVCVGALGFLLGPGIIGDPLFHLLNRNKINAFKAKYKIFARHIINKRVDASRQSVSNPVPDYYGEKIGSLKDYRQWLRDCNTYRRKAREFL